MDGSYSRRPRRTRRNRARLVILPCGHDHVWATLTLAISLFTLEPLTSIWDKSCSRPSFWLIRTNRDKTQNSARPYLLIRSLITPEISRRWLDPPLPAGRQNTYKHTLANNAHRGTA